MKHYCRIASAVSKQVYARSAVPAKLTYGADDGDSRQVTARSAVPAKLRFSIRLAGKGWVATRSAVPAKHYLTLTGEYLRYVPT